MIDISETKCIPPEPSGKPDEFEREMGRVLAVLERFCGGACLYQKEIRQLHAAHEADMNVLRKTVKPDAPPCPDKHYTLFTKCPSCEYGGVIYQTHDEHGIDRFCPKCGVMFDWSEGGAECL